jgi:ketosteroid isomerase-like protein
MNWLFESPITIVAIAVAIAFFLVVAWVQTGRNAFLYAIGGVVALAILGLVIERYVETEREAITKLVYEIAAKIEANDADAVVAHVVSSRPELASRGRSEMGQHEFDEVTVTRIHNVESFPDRQPPEIVVEFNVQVSGSFMNGQVPLETLQRYLKVTFWKDHDGQWRIADYEHHEPQAFMFKRSE